MPRTYSHRSTTPFFFNWASDYFHLRLCREVGSAAVTETPKIHLHQNQGIDLLSSMEIHGWCFKVWVLLSLCSIQSLRDGGRRWSRHFKPMASSGSVFMAIPVGRTWERAMTMARQPPLSSAHPDEHSVHWREPQSWRWPYQVTNVGDGVKLVSSWLLDQHHNQGAARSWCICIPVAAPLHPTSGCSQLPAPQRPET